MTIRALSRVSLWQILFAFCALLLLAPHTAYPETPRWSGSVKSLNLSGEEAPTRQFPNYSLSSNRLRLNMDWRLHRDWSMETSLDYLYLWSDPQDLFPLPEGYRNRHMELHKSWQHGHQGASLLQIDRLNLHWRNGSMDVTVGRQAVGFGRILIYSPLDIIAPFAPDALDTDIRSGVDALQGIYNYGQDGQVGTTAVWGEDPDDSSLLVTWTDNRKEVDLLMITGTLRAKPMFGVGLAGSLGSLGLKGEISVYQGKKINKPGGDLHARYAIAAIETWYRFAGGTTLITQYLYNGPGVNDPENYHLVLASAPLQEGLTTLLGRHYLMLAPAYEIHPLMTVQGLLIYNIADGSALIRPALDLNLADNVSLQIFWATHVGREPRVIAPFSPAEPRSEFGMSGDSGGLFLKYFF